MRVRVSDKLDVPANLDTVLAQLVDHLAAKGSENEYSTQKNDANRPSKSREELGKLGLKLRTGNIAKDQVSALWSASRVLTSIAKTDLARAYAKNINVENNFEYINALTNKIFALQKSQVYFRTLLSNIIKKEKEQKLIEEQKFIHNATSFLRAEFDRLSLDADGRKDAMEKISRGVLGEVTGGVNQSPSSPEPERDRVSPLSEAPGGEKYVTHAKPGEDIVSFLDRAYGKRGYLTGEFTRADLRKVDPSAAKALDNWEQATKQRPKRRAPLNLPTLKEKNDRLLSQAPDQTPVAVKEHERLRSIARRRQAKLEK